MLCYNIFSNLKQNLLAHHAFEGKEERREQMKKMAATSLIAFMLAVPAFAVFCPPVSGDNTQNLRACIAQAAATDNLVILADFCDVDSSGHFVDLPGAYPISDQIIVPSSVKILGSGTYWGATINVNFGQGLSNTDSSHAAFVLKDNAAIDGVTFFYPAQTKGIQLIEFPPTISVQGSFCRVLNSFFPNSYVGIDATVPHGKLNMENLEFGMYYRAIRDDQCYDVDKFVTIHANPGMWATWKDDSNVIGWMMNNSATLEVSRIDWLYVEQLFAFGTKYGILMTAKNNGSVGEAQIIQAGCDACRYGIYSNIQNVSSYPWLITISNWSGTAFDPVSGKGSGTSIYLANVNGVNISNSNFWGIRDDGVYLENCTGVILTGNNFQTDNWNQSKNGSSAFHLVKCKRVTAMANTGASTNGGAAFTINGGDDMSFVANQFNVQGPSITLNGATNVKTSVNSGCVQDSWNDQSNRIDYPCSVDYFNTPIPTPTPTVTPTNPTVTPTPTPAILPTRIPKTGPANP